MACSMQNNESINIDRAIWKITKPTPDNSLFTNYKDFMCNKHIIPYYKFNVQFLNQLLTLTEMTFVQDGRFNRTMMFDMIKVYICEHKAKIDLPIRNKIFNLLKYYYEKTKISSKTKNNILPILKDLALSCEAERWFCEMQNRLMQEECDCYSLRNKTEFLNRILRYPAKSKVISDWIATNYSNDHLRLRRAETIGWILNENIDFVVDEQTLIDDFEFTNSLDKKAIYLAANQDGDEDIMFDNLSKNSLDNKFFYRPYACVTYNHRQNTKPNFKELRQFFNQNIEKIKYQTMLWAVAYSHLSSDEKITLIKRYYLSDLFATTFKIANKYKLVKLLIWLKNQPKEDNVLYQHFELKNIPIKQADTKKTINKMQYSKEVIDKLEYLINTLDLEIID